MSNHRQPTRRLSKSFHLNLNSMKRPDLCQSEALLARHNQFEEKEFFFSNLFFDIFQLIQLPCLETASFFKLKIEINVSMTLNYDKHTCKKFIVVTN